MIDLTSDLDPETVPDDWWLERMRLHRSELLASSDWTQAADNPTGDAAAWATYRQQLRDAPANWTPGPNWNPPAAPS